MININIPTEVPEFFRNVKSKELLKKNPTDLYSFLVEKLNPQTDEQKYIIYECSHNYHLHQRILIPIDFIGQTTDKYYFKIKGKWYTKNDQQIELVTSPITYEHISTYDLYSAHFVNNGKQTTHTNQYNYIKESIVEHFNLEKILSQLNNDIFELYENEKSVNEASFELELYNHWLEHNLKIINNFKSK